MIHCGPLCAVAHVIFVSAAATLAVVVAVMLSFVYLASVVVRSCYCLLYFWRLCLLVVVVAGGREGHVCLMSAIPSRPRPPAAYRKYC